MGFLLKMEDKRTKEKEELAEIRKTERKEDREEMIKLMDNCLGEKVEEAIAPFKERTEKVEKEQLEMKDQVNMILDEMKLVKERLNGGRIESGQSSSVVTMAEVISRQQDPRPMQQAPTAHAGSSGIQEDERRRIISLSRRTIGLQKIDKYDLARMRQDQFGGAKSEEEEKFLAVKEYLQLEIKLSRKTIDQMEIERIFTPARDNPEWLYVTFRYESSVSKVFEKTRIMRKESRILTYIPKEFRSRFEAIRDLGNIIRLEEKCKTRIKMGYMDLQLHKKDSLIGKWELVPLPAGIPPVEVRGSPGKVESGSPAPGRPGQMRSEKRGRQSTGSDGQGTPKAAKKGKDDRSDTGSGSDLDSNLQDEQAEVMEETGANNLGKDATGKVVEEESYCPASPAPAKAGSSFPYSSPIFTKSKTSTLTMRPMIL